MLHLTLWLLLHEVSLWRKPNLTKSGLRDKCHRYTVLMFNVGRISQVSTFFRLHVLASWRGRLSLLWQPTRVNSPVACPRCKDSSQSRRQCHSGDVSLRALSWRQFHDCLQIYMTQIYGEFRHKYYFFNTKYFLGMVWIELMKDVRGPNSLSSLKLEVSGL